MKINSTSHSMLKNSFISLVFFLLYFPIAVLIFYSFNQARYSLQWKGFSIQWYKELFNDQSLWGAFFNSTLLGIAAGLMATLIGLIACIQLFLYHKRFQKSFFLLLMVLIVIPDLVFGVGLLIFFNFFSIPLGFLSLLIAHITFCIPFTVVTIQARIQHLDANIYFSALDLGASRWQAFKKILLPLLWPSVLSAFLLSFTLSFDDVIISYFLAGPDFTILPLTIYSLVRAGVTPELNALCSFTFFISMVLVILSHRLSRDKP